MVSLELELQSVRDPRRTYASWSRLKLALLAAGDCIGHLKQAVREHLGYVLPIYADDVAHGTAKGTAEIRRRISHRKKLPGEN
jgi:hypothetical protein